MTQVNSTPSQPIHRAPLVARMLQGAAIAFTLILIFLLGNDYSDPAWGKYWMIRPLIVVPIAGAMGGVWYYFLDELRCQGGWKQILAIIMSVVGYTIILWLGTVFGLDGTMWN